jgi:hypothetical protein
VEGGSRGLIWGGLLSRYLPRGTEKTKKISVKTAGLRDLINTKEGCSHLTTTFGRPVYHLYLGQRTISDTKIVVINYFSQKTMHIWFTSPKPKSFKRRYLEEGVDCIQQAQKRVQWRTLVNTAMNCELHRVK